MIDDLSADESYLSFNIEKPVKENVFTNLCADSDMQKKDWLEAFDEYNTKC